MGTRRPKPTKAIKSSIKKENMASKAAMREGQWVTSQSKITTGKVGGKVNSRDAKTNSPRKPSVAKVALKGAKNKMKAQGAKINSAPTSRLSQGRRGK